MNTMNEKALAKIPAFNGQKAKNSRKVIKLLADKGPQIKYEIWDRMKPIPYATVSRRIDDLVKRGYLGVATTTRTKTHYNPNASKVYGLTWKGLIAGLLLRPTKDIGRIMKANPLLDFDHKDRLLGIIEAIYTPQEINETSEKVASAIIEHLPSDIESIPSADLGIYAFPTILSMGKELPFDKIEKNKEKLLEIPIIKDTFLRIVDHSEKELRRNLESIELIRKLLTQGEGGGSIE
jgi:DNA-binding Lrp family transcriptional regulator